VTHAPCSAVLLLGAVLFSVGCAGNVEQRGASPSPAAPGTATPLPPDAHILATDKRTRFRELWLNGQTIRLRRELADFSAQASSAAQNAADAAFLNGDRAAGFLGYWRPQFSDVATTSIGGWYEEIATNLRGTPYPPRDRVTAALLIGDAEAACGRFRQARAAWMQSLSEGRMPALPHVYYPEWTSSLRRLLAYQHAPERSRDDVQCITAEAVDAANAKWNAQIAQASAKLDVAWGRLAHGEARAALASFDSVMPFWRRTRNVGGGYADVERGTIIAALFAREDGRAKRELQVIRQEWGGESRATALIFAGRWTEGLVAYRDETAHEPLAEGVDPVVAAGVAAALAGDWREAIVAWSGVPSGHGPDYLEDYQTALIGIARAHLGDWNGAVDAWLEATRMGRPVPEWEPLESGNVVGLEMLYHFRDRYPRGDHSYQLRVDLRR
jgi:hypothetical protein